MIARFCSLFLFIFSTLLGAQQTINLPKPSACTTEEKTHFDQLKNTYDISGIDSDGGDIGVYAARAIVVVVPRDWRPFLNQKQTFCGKLDHFNWFHTIWIPDEQDWNNVIVPTEVFQPMFADAKRLVSKVQGLPDCVKSPPGTCLEMEITPGQEGYRNQFFDKADLTQSGSHSSLEGQTLCFYGPWVNDEVHGTHPEIHPSELLWWQETDKVTGKLIPSWWLLSVTDESERFAQRHDFPGAPSGESWLPWAAKPRHDTWRVLIDKAANDTAPAAFSVASSLDTTGLEDVDLNANTVTTVTVDGVPWVEFHKSDVLLKGMKVNMAGVCLDDRDSRVKGFLELEMRLGSGSPSRAGIAMVNLVSGATPPQRAGLGNEEKLTLNFIPKSVRKYKRTIIADFEQKGQQPPAQEFKLNMIPGANVSSSPRCRSLGKNCSSLAILSKDKQQKMLLMHGEQQPLIQVKISSRVVHRLKTAKAPVSAVREIRKREKRLASTKDLRWERTRRVTLRTKLFYVSTKDGNAAPEESSPLINELNEKLNGPQAALLFGALPFSIADQQAMGTDETTGQAVPVRTNGPAQSDAEASAILTHTAGNNWDLNVTFPKANPEHLYSVMYHARVVDNFGNDGEIDQQVWNHELKIHKTTDVAGMIDQLLQIAGTDPGSIRKDANISGLPPEFWGVASAKQRRAGMVLQRAGEIVQTMDVALFDDIEKLLNLVQLYSGT